MIHPTAIVHPGAQIDASCEIGPYCVIGPHVVMGAGCKLHSHVVIDGHTRLGKENNIYPFASIGLRSQDLKYKGGLTRTEIGDYNNIRENVTIHSATEDGDVTVIGSHNNILGGSHLGHDVRMGDHTIISMAGLAGHVHVEDYAIVGGMVGVHQFCRIGTMSIIGGCSKINQDVPPYMLVDGNPAETRMVNKLGLERNGVSEESQAALRQAHKILFRDGLTFANGLQRLEAEFSAFPEVMRLAQFVKTSERGVTR